MSSIRRIHGRQILDSRGNPTVEVDLELDGGAHGRAAVPSGASTGEFEATELRDGGAAWNGKGVGRAVASVNGEIADALTGFDGDQATLDRRLIELDGTANKSRLGANAILGVSLAYAHARADEAGVPLWRLLGGESAVTLPVPMMNVLNGGVHADNSVDFQEFMIVPYGADSFHECLRIGGRGLPRAESHARTPAASGRRSATRAASHRTWIPTSRPSRCSIEAIGAAGYEPGRDVGIALDPASSEFYRDGAYDLEHEGRTLSAQEMADYWETLVDRYPIVSLEDGMDEEDWEGWRHLTERLGDRIQLVGDDIFVTNTARLRRGIEAQHRQLDPDQGQPDRHASPRRSKRSRWRAPPATRR